MPEQSAPLMPAAFESLADMERTPEKTVEPASKRRKKEKTPEETLAAEALMAEKKQQQAAVKEAAKTEKQAARGAAKAAAQVEKEEGKRRAKEEREQLRLETERQRERVQVFNIFLKEIGDALKDHVQGRSTSMQLRMTDEQYNFVFRNHPSCTKEITTKCTYADGRVTTSVQNVPSSVHLDEGSVQGLFGVGKTKGGSFNRFHGATSWNIVSMTVKRPSPGMVSLHWRLSSGADWSR